MSATDNLYVTSSGRVTDGAPAGDAKNNDYVSRPEQKQSPIPVQPDGADIEDPVDPAIADSDEQLGMFRIAHRGRAVVNFRIARDDTDAIDQSNVIGDRTRGAKPTGGYREPGDEEGLPGPEDGTSEGAQ